MNIAAVVMTILFLMVPQKTWYKPDEPVNVRFAAAAQEQAATVYQAIGIKAADVPQLFKPAGEKDFFDEQGNPLFKLYSFDGKLIAPQKGDKPDAAGVINISSYYPQIATGGTYILTLKNSPSLVISAQFNPGKSPRDLEKLPINQREQMRDYFSTPTVIYVRPLEYAVISTDQGDIQTAFYYDVAPHTVDNFITLAKGKFYDDSSFHRIIKGFMIQGGDSRANSAALAGTGGPGYQIMQEFSDRPHVKGVLSMARSSDPNSAGSQFFIVHGAARHLDGAYTAFGNVTAGIDIVDKLADTPADRDSGLVAPDRRPKIKSIHIMPAPAEMYIKP